MERIEGVGKITNNIQVLPMGRFDMEIRAQARIRLQRMVPMYFWPGGADIRIIVKRGDIILLGTVIRQADKDIATIQCNTVPNSFHVYNMLRVEPGAPRRGKKG